MKPYPAYKDSGVEWLGEVPEGWRFAPTWSLFRRVKRTDRGDEELLSVYRDYGVIPKASRDDNFNKPSEDLSAYQLVEVGDLAINKMKAWQGSVAISEYRGIVSPAYFIFTPTHRESSRYLHYLLRSGEYTSAYQAISKGVRPNQWDLEPQEHSRMPVLLPPLPEQQAIAAFLDRETAKIDGLIEEQRRLIALLAEKRQATISHAVTRGLNPDASLKPSGVDWLGDIPEGGEVVPLKRHWSVTDCKHLTAEFVDDGYPLASIREVQSRHVYLAEAKQTTAEYYEQLIEGGRKPTAGDLIFSRNATVGEVAQVHANHPLFAMGQDVCLLRKLRDDFSSDFMQSFLKSSVIQKQLDILIIGSTFKRINIEAIRNLTVVFPPVPKQQRIAQFVEREVGKFDALAETATNAITLLQERRAALISAAVTGKIDVREVAKVPAQASQSLHVSAMVAGVIIARHGQHLGFGRMMVQKFLFMTQACANAPEIGGDYERQAAGPLDRDLQNRVEADLEAARLVRVRQEGGRGSRVQYEFLGDAAALHAELASALGDRMERFDYLSNQLGGLTKNGIEAVATLYAAWNDFLIDGRTPDRADIIGEVLENWHPEKSRKFTADELGTWLDWMERQNIVPDGTGPQTQTGRLFP
ncbi:restriction endonuclease subunit S [Paracoccus sp. (in: a-proteobacteria)]|uniref:restriction endonuclease subunit S n=1 Tax=Paracoccus sp. TaxID=267 RepID=UPI0028A6DD86|nr:restriction endonuclease subunit S [Paracoccus sp. (in: a-proteobacteria)]